MRQMCFSGVSFLLLVTLALLRGGGVIPTLNLVLQKATNPIHCALKRLACAKASTKPLYQYLVVKGITAL